MEASPSTSRGSRRTAVSSLAAIGFGLAALGLILGLVVDPAFFAVWALALLAFALSWYFSTRAAPPDDVGGEPRTGESATPLPEAEAVHDPSHNPYGRQDP